MVAGGARLPVGFSRPVSWVLQVPAAQGGRRPTTGGVSRPAGVGSRQLRMVARPARGRSGAGQPLARSEGLTGGARSLGALAPRPRPAGPCAPCQFVAYPPWGDANGNVTPSAEAVNGLASRLGWTRSSSPRTAR